MRYEITATITVIGTRKHVVKADDLADAKLRFGLAYPDRKVQFTRCVTLKAARRKQLA